MQIKAIVGYRFVPTSKTPVKKRSKNKFWWDMEKLESLSISSRSVKCTITLADTLSVSQKLNIELPYDTTFLSVGICTREIKTYYTKACAYICTV
jgi:hypothetical protein